MTYDRETQSTASTNTEQTETASTFGRRTFLKYAVVSSLAEETGRRTLSKEVTAAEISEGSSSSGLTTGKQRCEKSLCVKGSGSGLNHYHLETSGSIIPRDTTDEQQKSVDESVVEGTVRKGDFASYGFTGRVTTVWTRGNITYYVNDSVDNV